MSFQLPAGYRPAAPPQGGAAGPQGAQAGQANDEERAAKQAQVAEMKRGMIQQILEPEARERLSRIALTRPELASSVEDLLVRMGTQGKIRGQVSDEDLKRLLEQVSAPAAPKSTQPKDSRSRSLGAGITIQRKRDDSDSDEYDL